MERHIKLMVVLYLQFLEEDGRAYQGGCHMGSMPGNQLNQASCNLRESEDPWTDAINGVRVEYTSKKCEGIFIGAFEYHWFTISRRSGSCGKGQH